MSDQERDRRLVEQLVSRATQEPLAEPRMSIAAHHDEISFEPLGLCNQRCSDVVVAKACVMQRGLDAVVLEVID